ncbi:MAG: rod shape-determining protein RodA, partial [Planctomycetaceae bacterium]|nr:rod shape-determining protein RodA [Planctomycetaceae bacterium]
TALDRGDELNPGRFAAKQSAWIVLSLPAMLLAAGIPYRLWKTWAVGLFWGSVFLLAFVFLLPAKYGSHRWIPLGQINLQPSELAKLSFILMLAQHLMHSRNHRVLTGLFKPFLVMFIPVVLILREPDLGTALLFIPVLFAMLFAAGARWSHLVLVTVCGIMLMPALWRVMSAEQRSRVTAVFRQQDGGEIPRGDEYHLHQSKQMVAFGGLLGSELSGAAVSDSLAYHLPASRTDFVFCLLAERWGSVGVIAVLVLYLALIGQGLRIAAATREPFGRLLAVGIVTLLAAQVVINTGMTVGLMPITGLTLPLLSYGGSSLLMTSVALGLLISVGLRPGFEVGRDPFRY